MITHCLINHGDNNYNKYIQGVLRCNWVIYVGSYRDLRAKLIKEVHDIGMGGHSGVRVIIKRLQQLFYWPNLSLEVKAYIKNCLACQQMKSESIAAQVCCNHCRFLLKLGRE